MSSVFDRGAEPGAEALPAVCWRLQNLAKLDGMKRAAFLSRLGDVLGLPD
jgi:hypothetical protein